jgi:hypothetical protein
MDWTDESEPQTTLHAMGVCAWSPSFDCFERLCQRNHFSCGDGQCLPQGMNRFEGLWLDTVPLRCASFRDINFICELHGYWTVKDGFCLPFQDLAYTDWKNAQMNQSSWCAFLLQCLLSHDINSDCPCSNLEANCTKQFQRDCSLFEYIPYPSGPLMNPFTWTLYHSQRVNWTTIVPDKIRWQGSIKCK